MGNQILKVKDLVEYGSHCPICEGHEMVITSTGHIEWTLPYKETEANNAGFRELKTTVYCPEDHEEEEPPKGLDLVFTFHGQKEDIKAFWEITHNDTYMEAIDCGRVWTIGWKQYLSLLDPIVAIYYQPRITTNGYFVRKIKATHIGGEKNGNRYRWELGER